MEYGISNLDFEIYNFYKVANFRPPTVNNLGNQSELTEVWREKEDYSNWTKTQITVILVYKLISGKRFPPATLCRSSNLSR